MTRDEIKNTPDLVDFLLDESVIATSREKLHKRLNEVCNLAIKALEQEPRKGHWIKGYTFPDGEYWKCDKCNELIKVKYPMHYCNNCGSDNREVEE